MPSTLMPQVVSLFVIPLLLSYNGTVHCALTTLSDHNHVSKSWQCQTGLADFFFFSYAVRLKLLMSLNYADEHE